MSKIIILASLDQVFVLFVSCVVQHPVIYSVFSVNTKQEEKQRNSRRQNRAERPMEEKERREEREKVCTAQVGPQPRQDNNAKGNETKRNEGQGMT